MNDSFKQSISNALHRVIPELSLEEIDRLLEQPPNSDLGDWAFPCFKLAGSRKMAPHAIAEEISKHVPQEKEFKRVSSNGPYVNFFLNKELLASEIIPTILKQSEMFGSGIDYAGKKIMVEFSSPNTNKPLHIGHLRNNGLGMSLSNLMKFQGWKVVKANLINDRGIHICKSMLAYKKYGNGKTPKSEKTKSDHFVGTYYVLFNQKSQTYPNLEDEARELLRKWESKDPETRKLWKQMNDWAVQGMNETYQETGVSFDKTYFESEIYESGKSLVLQGLRKGIFEKLDDGAIIARLEPHGLPDKIVLRSDGTSVYTTQDIALAQKKFSDYPLDSSLYVVANEQNLHFQQLFKIVELLELPFSGKLKHVSYGMVHLPEGKMKSREGKVVDADDLISELKRLALEEVKKRFPELSKKECEKRSKSIALAALKFFLLRVDSSKDMLFNPKESISFDGETGPYLLYSYARSKSILSKAKSFPKTANYNVLQDDSEKQLIKTISEFPFIAKKCADSMQPHTLCQYLLQLASEFNSFYHAVPVIQEDKEFLNARLRLVKSFSVVMQNGLALLDIETLEKM